MSTLTLAFWLTLTFTISFWNAFASGAYLTESKLVGGWSRLLVWCGLIMSGCGFTWVYLTLLAIGALKAEWLTPEWAEVMFKLGYLVIILPVLGSGLGIWIHSLMQAYRRRSFGSVAVAGWNTYAQVRNTWEAASNAPNFLEDVVDAFASKRGKSSKDGAMAVLVLVLVVIAVLGGAITTGLIARWADRKIALRVARA